MQAKTKCKRKVITPFLSSSSLFWWKMLILLGQSLACCLHGRACGLVQEKVDMSRVKTGLLSAELLQCLSLPLSICRWMGRIPSSQKSLNQQMWVMLARTSLTVADRRCRWPSESRGCHNCLETLALGTNWCRGQSRNCLTCLEGKRVGEGKGSQWSLNTLRKRSFCYHT